METVIKVSLKITENSIDPFVRKIFNRGQYSKKSNLVNTCQLESVATRRPLLFDQHQFLTWYNELQTIEGKGRPRKRHLLRVAIRQMACISVCCNRMIFFKPESCTSMNY